MGCQSLACFVMHLLAWSSCLQVSAKNEMLVYVKTGQILCMYTWLSAVMSVVFTEPSSQPNPMMKTTPG